MSLWELAVAAEAWARANGAENEPRPLSPEEYDADMLKAAERRATVH